MRRICRYLPLFVLPLVGLQFANAQSGIDFGIGFGGANAPAAKTGIDTALNPCTLGSAGVPVDAEPEHFHDRHGRRPDAVEAFRRRRRSELRAQQEGLCDPDAATGAGGPAFHREVAIAHHALRFQRDFPAAQDETRSAQAVRRHRRRERQVLRQRHRPRPDHWARQNFSQYFASSNHFQVHGGVGVQIYPSEHLFIRPEFNIHYVHNLNQFGRDSVVALQVWLGYTFGQ